MNDEALATARRHLLRLQTELQDLEDSTRQSGQTVELDQSRVGRLSRMDAMQAQQMALEGGRRRQQRLAAIVGALSRIDSGDYGYCFVCGNEIDSRRLAFDPTSTRCMSCVES